jgi:hypothetical protein
MRKCAHRRAISRWGFSDRHRLDGSPSTTTLALIDCIKKEDLDERLARYAAQAHRSVQFLNDMQGQIDVSNPGLDPNQHSRQYLLRHPIFFPIPQR